MDQFKHELQTVIDEAIARGVEPIKADEVASEVCAHYSTAKVSIYTDAFLRIFLTVSCTFMAFAIYIFSELHGHSSPFMPWVFGVCLLAATAHFFPVERVVNALRGRLTDDQGPGSD